MYNLNDSDCSQYLDSAEWLRLSDILNEWCKLDHSCKKIKELAILGACENQQIEYMRNDGKTFEDPVVELEGRGLLLINKRSFNRWKIKFENKEKDFDKKNQNSISLLDFLKNEDAEYISISDAIDSIHRHLGSSQDISMAVQLLNLAIGRANEPPNIYKKDDFKSWIPIVLTSEYHGDFIEAPNPSDQAKLKTIHYFLNKVLQSRLTKDLDDDLPF
ncbi:TPA: hypothetical protein NEQ15_001087 [Acinetobacter baumannii]|jgi:hypothetical protein|uniref:hypothetical protein n=1 Tax=Acinetobacter TaxID=469 RepID=UPI001EE9A75E|nr:MULTISPECIES: hypothetical protein [Acinetobacter]MCG5791991.1 hypothetical protein [Acinetobacter baumannii]WBX39015.1 hypothetical protein MYA84_05055 [Acinetobacter schindleri]HAV5510585.1 hypothetical protein [Acinetobacter baumannii]HCE0435343.1 hypothetical protein [Acinetobacter baumannii]